MNMQMLERYLQAIEFWLPKEERRDILAEISEDLNSQIEDKQAALGRKLTESELETVLRQRGRPVLVANRYRKQQSLIGPLLFPAYVFVLKMAGLFYVLPQAIVFVVVHRVQHPGLHWIATVTAAWATIWTLAFVAAGTVTLIFVLLELAETRTHFLENWNPRQLPPVCDPFKIPLSTSIPELAANLVFLVWWIAAASSPQLFNGSGFKLTLAPSWMFYFWGYVAIAVVNVALAAVNLRHRHWTALRAWCRLGSDVAGGALFCWLMHANIIATLYIAKLDPARTLAVKDAIHLWMQRCFPIAVAISMIAVVVDLVRIVRVTRKERLVVTGGVMA
jgi:hypothetical protein